MTNNNTAVARQQPQTLKSLLRDPVYQDRFKEILGARAAQFVSSVLSVGSSLGSDCEPTSIIASAMTAATLDLPVDKNLGFAWIVPYKQNGRKLAQFQMGYKGYIQLGLRTGQYERMNARVINAEAFKGWDEVGEPIIDWSLVDESKPSVGYAFAFKLVNGFTKIAFWPRERVEAHAKRFSQSYKGNYASPWTSDFDSMALKTVIKNELAKWGIMSIEMVNAIKLDQSTKQSLDDDPSYPDGTDLNGNGNGSDPAADAITKISEEQRTALVQLAQERGVVEKLGAIVTAAGFEMLADITVDKYDDVSAQIVNAGAIDVEPQTSEPGAGDQQPAETVVDKTASKKADWINQINDKLKEMSDGDPAKMVALTGGADLTKLTAGQLKDLYLELEKKQAG